MRWLKTFFSKQDVAPALPARVPQGERVYAIGDIHGRLDLFESLIAAIEADDAASPVTKSTVILLGDLVDRGPDSAGVLARARTWQSERTVRILAGNHEEMFLSSFESLDVLRHFLRHGGRETLISYGVGKRSYVNATLDQVMDLMHAHVPAEDRTYIANFEDHITIGDYYFAHAGVDPSKALSAQEPRNLRWIREPFLSHAVPLEKAIVHGHTITATPQDNGVRIGVDTGAYNSGILTALILEGTKRRYLAAKQNGPDDIVITQTPSLA